MKHLKSHFSVDVLFALALGAVGMMPFSGCAKAGPYYDLTAPVVLEVCGDRVGEDPLPISPYEPLEIRFSEPLAGDGVGPERIFLVQSEDLAFCSEDADCQLQAPGRFVRCIQGGCQASSVDRAFVEDAATSSLSSARAALVVPALVELSGDRVLVTPVSPLDPNRLYDLVFAASVTDLAANPLVDQKGRPGTWVRLRTGDPLSTCVRVSLVRPVSGLTAVPTNLAKVLVVAQEAVPWDMLDAMTLGQAEAPSGQSLAWRQVACPPVALVMDLTGDATAADSWMTEEGSEAGLGWEPEDRACYEADVTGPLLASAKYELRAPFPGSGGARPGRCLNLGHGAWFAAAQGPQNEGPEILQSDLVQQGPCAKLVLGASAPVEWVVRAWPQGEEGGPRPVWTRIRLGQTAMEVLGLEPGSLSGPISLVATATDLWGRTRSAGPFVLTPRQAAEVAITEVLANPAGTEPDQEFVELLNLGDEPVSLSGWSLAKGAAAEDAQTISGGVLAPGQFAILAGPGYDPLAASDEPAAPGALVIRLDENLTGNGLSNSGEALFLLDGFGQVVSAYDQPLAVSASRFNGVSVERTSRDLCVSGSVWQANPEGRSTPGAPNDSWQ